MRVEGTFRTSSSWKRKIRRIVRKRAKDLEKKEQSAFTIFLIQHWRRHARNG